MRLDPLSVLLFVAVVSLTGYGSAQMDVRYRVDFARSRDVMQRIQDLMPEEPVISYERYNLYDDLEANCKDFAFAFAVLYGHPARVRVGHDHAWVDIRGLSIEPQQPVRFYRNPTVFRIRYQEYSLPGTRLLRIAEDDAQVFRDLFGTIEESRPRRFFGLF